MTTIRREIAAVVTATYKTGKGADNRVARDTDWAAGFDTADKRHTVEVRVRWDEEQGRTLYDVVYVTYAVIQPADVPVGAQGQVSGTRYSPVLGTPIPYGYAARFQGVDERTGRLKALNYSGSLVVRDDEDVTVYAVQDAVACDACGALEGEECRPGCTALVALQNAAEDDCPHLGHPCGACGTPTESWWLKVSGQGGDSTTEYADLTEALDAWRAVLEHQPFADLQVLHAFGDNAPTVYADVAEHDTCTVHRDAVFSKDGPCPVCVEEDERGWNDKVVTARQVTSDRLTALLERDDAQGFLTSAERIAVQTALDVLA